jgi:hypothetical protein
MEKQDDWQQSKGQEAVRAERIAKIQELDATRLAAPRMCARNLHLPELHPSCVRLRERLCEQQNRHSTSLHGIAHSRNRLEGHDAHIFAFRREIYIA